VSHKAANACSASQAMSAVKRPSAANATIESLTLMSSMTLSLIGTIISKTHQNSS